MRIPSLNSNARFTNWKSEINLKFNSILFSKVLKNEQNSFNMRILKFFENWFLKCFLCRFIFGRHALFKEEFANKDLSAIGEIENTAQFIFDPENEDWKWAPTREKTSEDMKARNLRTHVITSLNDPVEISNECMQTLFWPHEFPAGLP